MRITSIVDNIDSIGGVYTHYHERGRIEIRKSGTMFDIYILDVKGFYISDARSMYKNEAVSYLRGVLHCLAAYIE